MHTYHTHERMQGAHKDPGALLPCARRTTDPAAPRGAPQVAPAHAHPGPQRQRAALGARAAAAQVRPLRAGHAGARQHDPRRGAQDGQRRDALRLPLPRLRHRSGRQSRAHDRPPALPARGIPCSGAPLRPHLGCAARRQVGIELFKGALHQRCAAPGFSASAAAAEQSEYDLELSCQLDVPSSCDEVGTSGAACAYFATSPSNGLMSFDSSEPPESRTRRTPADPPQRSTAVLGVPLWFPKAR